MFCPTKSTSLQPKVQSVWLSNAEYKSPCSLPVLPTGLYVGSFCNRFTEKYFNLTPWQSLVFLALQILLPYLCCSPNLNPLIQPSFPPSSLCITLNQRAAPAGVGVHILERFTLNDTLPQVRHRARHHLPKAVILELPVVPQAVKGMS